MLIALDTETGGLKPEINPILSFALYTPNEEFYVQIKGDPKWCDAVALKINGLDPTQGVTPQEGQEQIVAFWTKLGQPKFEPIGHNVQFDIGFIKQLGLPTKMFDYHLRDSLVAMALLKDSGKIQIDKLKLQSCCDYFGIKYEAHNALEDAKAAWQLWNKCLDLIRSPVVS